MMPPSSAQTFTKVILHRNTGKATAAVIECPSREIKNLVCRLIQTKISEEKGRTRSGASAIPTPTGVSVDKGDFKNSTHCSDAHLQFRPSYAKLNAASSITAHADSLIKAKL